MPKSVKLTVLTPEKLFFSDDVTQIVAVMPDGEVGVMAGYIPSVSLISDGLLKIERDSKWTEADVGQGFMKVSAEGIEFFVDCAKWAEGFEGEEPNYERFLAGSEPSHEETSEQRVAHKEYLRTHATIHRALDKKKPPKK